MQQISLSQKVTEAKMDGSKKDMEAKMDDMEDNMDGLKKGMEAKMEGKMEDLKTDLTKLLREMFINRER